MPTNLVRALLQDDHNEDKYAYISLTINDDSRLYILVKSTGIPYFLEGFHLELYPSLDDSHGAAPIISATRELGWAALPEDMEIATSLFHETVAKLAIDTGFVIKAVIDNSEEAFARAMLKSEGDISLEIMDELLE